jgi:hypothetical protein
LYGYKGQCDFGTLRLTEIFGWTEEEVMGKISDHIIPENYRIHDNGMDHYIKTGKESFE